MMKKFLFVAVAALTLGLASCSESTKTDEAAAVIENMKMLLQTHSVIIRNMICLKVPNMNL